MAILVAVIIAIVIFGVCDHICYWRRLDAFYLRAKELVKMYNYLSPKVLNGDLDDPKITEFEYEGDFFKIVVKLKDLKTFYFQIQWATAETLEAYDRIGERYLSEMDDETSDYIEEIHRSVQGIENEINYQTWLLGFRKV